MATPILTADEVRDYIRDTVEENHLLDKEEFPIIILNKAIELAISEYNIIPPLSSVDIYSFPGKALLMSGALYKAFAGQSALLARNTMNYSDGGLQIPVEERFQLYQALASMYQADFVNAAKSLKIHLNIESGWGMVNSDYNTMPVW